jgi:hypothetical protein
MENVFGVYYIPCSLKVYLVDVITAFLVAVKRRRLACPHIFLYHVCVLSWIWARYLPLKVNQSIN